jgi:hypothetical protein
MLAPCSTKRSAKKPAEPASTRFSRVWHPDPVDLTVHGEASGKPTSGDGAVESIRANLQDHLPREPARAPHCSQQQSPHPR